jgi:hypothetical protein
MLYLLTNCFSLTGDGGGGAASPEVGRQVRSL